jgi:hypothetical protein
MKPDFIIAGIMKSGTTYLDNLVRGHPEVYMPKRLMDYSFFDNDEIFKKGLEWYKSIFQPPSNDLVVGQTSADCAFNRGSIERIKQVIPNVKLVFIVREPIARSYSLYWHQVMMGREYNSFEEVIRKEPSRICKSYYNYKMYSYLERSRYKRQFDRVFSVFPKDQVLIIPFELLIKNELLYLNKVFRFINVKEVTSLDQLNVASLSKNPARIPSNMQVVRLSAALQRVGMIRIGRFILNRFLIQQRPPAMSDKTHAQLKEFFKEDIDFHKTLFQE